LAANPRERRKPVLGRKARIGFVAVVLAAAIGSGAALAATHGSKHATKPQSTKTAKTPAVRHDGQCPHMSGSTSSTSAMTPGL